MFTMTIPRGRGGNQMKNHPRAIYSDIPVIQSLGRLMWSRRKLTEWSAHKASSVALPAFPLLQCAEKILQTKPTAEFPVFTTKTT